MSTLTRRDIKVQRREAAARGRTVETNADKLLRHRDCAVLVGVFRPTITP